MYEIRYIEASHVKDQLRNLNKETERKSQKKHLPTLLKVFLKLRDQKSQRHKKKNVEEDLRGKPVMIQETLPSGFRKILRQRPILHERVEDRLDLQVIRAHKECNDQHRDHIEHEQRPENMPVLRHRHHHGQCRDENRYDIGYIKRKTHITPLSILTTLYLLYRKNQ